MATPSDTDVEVMFLQQQGNDPFTEVPARIAQAKAVASRIARFIEQAQSTLDIAIYDFRLHGDPASIISEAIRNRARAGVTIRIAFDAATNPEPHISAAEAPALLEADQKPPGTETFVRSFADVASLKAITGYRVLMHNKYIVRDALLPSAAVFTGSANYTNDSWGLQENNLLFLESQSLATRYAGDFSGLWSRGRIRDNPGSDDVSSVAIGDVDIAARLRLYPVTLRRRRSTILGRKLPTSADLESFSYADDAEGAWQELVRLGLQSGPRPPGLPSMSWLHARRKPRGHQRDCVRCCKRPDYAARCVRCDFIGPHSCRPV